MTAGLRLEGSMIPRRVKRMFDERGEPRDIAQTAAAIEWRGASLAVGLDNVSASGAMLVCSEIPHIGEAMTLHMPDRPPMPAVVCWVRDGRIGIHFSASLK